MNNTMEENGNKILINVIAGYAEREDNQLKKQATVNPPVSSLAQTFLTEKKNTTDFRKCSRLRNKLTAKILMRRL